MPPILSTSHCEFYGARSCAHAQKTIPMAPIHSFTKQIVPSMYQESFGTSIPHAPYKLLPSIINISGTRRSFLLSFSLHTFFMGLRELA